MNKLLGIAAFTALFFIAASDPAPPKARKAMVMISIGLTRNIGVEIDLDNPPTSEDWEQFAKDINPVWKEIEKIKPKLK